MIVAFITILILTLLITDYSLLMCGFSYSLLQDDGVEENGPHLPMLAMQTPLGDCIPQSSLVVLVSNTFILIHSHT